MHFDNLSADPAAAPRGRLRVPGEPAGMSASKTNTITKKELVNRIAGQTGQTKVVVKEVLQHFLNEIIDELSTGNRLEFREFGVFEVRTRAARRAQNPRTLEKVHVPAKRVVKFKVGRLMRQRVGGDDDEDEEDEEDEGPGAGLGAGEREREKRRARPAAGERSGGVAPPQPPPAPPATNSPF